jgi:two-component system phosphate regulon response regulator OmpR
MNACTRLLVVDDDEAVRTLLRHYLEPRGFEVAEAAGGAQMREQIARALPDAVLLDLRMPGEDGLMLARYLRERYTLGILMVTASSDVVERVVGLEVGADDYIAKPFDPRELLARIRSVLRRVQARQRPGGLSTQAAGEEEPTPAPRRLPFGRCEVDLGARQLFEAGGAAVALSAMEAALLAAFLDNPNRVLTRDQLLEKTRTREREAFDRSIDIRVGRLRRKVEPDPEGEPRVIRTVRNAGYMFVTDAAS